MSILYDKQGRPMDVKDVEPLLSDDVEYKRVAETTIDTPLGPVWVSTVWLGINYAFGGVHH